jgi:hypothetical protein
MDLIINSKSSKKDVSIFLQELAEDRKIEWFDSAKSKWRPFTGGFIDFCQSLYSTNYNYRIAPVPVKKVYRPYNQYEIDEFLGSIFISKDKKHKFMLVNIRPDDKDCILIEHCWTSSRYLFAYYRHPDGSPAGKEVV